jgi:thiosulfate/3-mercaptopyruvate sulfurtransferase
VKRIDCNHILLIMIFLGSLIVPPANVAASNVAISAEVIVADDPWSAAEVTRPEELAKRIVGADRPVILQIGVIYLYRMGHIPGSTFAGQAGSAEGIESLRKNVQEISRDREVVYYCGCCPWNDCPNIRPAYKLLKEMGFKKIRLLNLPNSFTQDWVKAGYPVEKSETR